MKDTSNRLNSLLAFAAICLLAGCVASKTVTIRSSPEGAKIFLNGQPVGTAPIKTNLHFATHDTIHEVVGRDSGLQDGTASITYDPKDRTEYTVVLKKVEAVPIELVSVEPERTEKGVKLVVVRKPTLAYLEVIERSPNVASVTKVTANEDKAVRIGPPILSPTEDVLIFSEFIEEVKGSTYSNIQKQRVGFTALTRLTYGKYRDLFPAFAPDGKRVIFCSNRTSSNPTLWIVNTEGPGGITKLTYTQAEDFSPATSPDGTWCFYASNPPEAEESQIWKVPMGGGMLTQLREGEAPQISSDGKRILFSRRDKITKKRQLWVMSIDGAEETQLTQNSDYEAIDARWSPDGKWIVLATDEGRDSQQNHNFDIWLMAADGSKRTQLTTNGSWDDGPCWDAKGEYIYFRSNRGGAWNIWRFKPILPMQ